MTDAMSTPTNNYAILTVNIVSAYIANNSMPIDGLAGLIMNVHGALRQLGTAATVAEVPTFRTLTAAEIRKSVSDNGIVSFIDGKSYKTMGRHLGSHGLNASTYRERYGLPVDYPMTAPAYSAQRSALAKKLGLGQQRRNRAPLPATPEAAVAQPKIRGRPKKVQSSNATK